MTPKVICPDVQRLMLEGEDKDLTSAERSLVEDHLRGCERCRGFAADRTTLKREAAAFSWPTLPQELDRRTRRMLREDEREPRPAAVPAWILVVLSVTALATTFWLAVSMADIAPDMTVADLPVTGLAAVFIIVQNMLMLLLAPVVLRAFRARRVEPESGR